MIERRLIEPALAPDDEQAMRESPRAQDFQRIDERRDIFARLDGADEQEVRLVLGVPRANFRKSVWIIDPAQTPGSRLRK